MGLRFRKSIKIAPGLKLNLSKTGVSLTAGTRGFHKTIHTSGRVTTTVSLPGTGISYVDTKYLGRDKTPSVSASQRVPVPAAGGNTASARLAARTQDPVPPVLPAADGEPEEDFRPLPLSEEALRGIHREADPVVDWIRYYRDTAPLDRDDPELWAYFHSMAPAILAGDTEAYLDVVARTAPLDDLLAYGGEFLFGTDRPSLMEVEFTANEEALSEQRLRLNVLDYFDLLQDYICSVTLRIARDMFSLLPVSDVVVHAVLEDRTVLSVRFDKETMERVPGGADASDVIARFEHRMDFQPARGFGPVDRIDTGSAGE